MHDLNTRWQGFLKRPFPSGWTRGEVNHVSLGALDSASTGCIQTYLSSGALDKHRLAVLRSCVDDLERVLPRLSGDVKAHFSELHVLATEVLATAAPE